jgi:hypothetical protein
MIRYDTVQCSTVQFNVEQEDFEEIVDTVPAHAQPGTLLASHPFHPCHTPFLPLLPSIPTLPLSPSPFHFHSLSPIPPPYPSLSLSISYQIGALANIGLATSKGLIGYSVNSTGG